MSDITMGSILEPVLLNTNIHDLESGHLHPQQVTLSSVVQLIQQMEGTPSKETWTSLKSGPK